jgi:Uma2 family endonuclease
MNVQLDLRMDRPEFLEWVQAHEGRYELVGSRVVMMTGGSRGHATLVLELAVALRKRINRHRWTVLTSDFGVALGPATVRYPDVVVDVAEGAFNDLIATAPILVAEILSPSSVKDDLGARAAEYLRLPSLSTYLVLAQDEPKAWIWVRGDTGFPLSPAIVTGRDARIEIPAHAIDLRCRRYSRLPARRANSARPAAPAAGGTRRLPRAASWPPRVRPRRRSSGGRSRRSASCAPLREISARHSRNSW